MTPEQKQRIEQIREQRTWRQQHAERFKINALIAANDDIDFLLPLVESQEAGSEQHVSNDQIQSDDRTERLLQLLVETPAGERIRMKCGAADLRSVIGDITASLPYVVNEVDAERLADYHKIGSMPAIIKSTDYGADTLAECVEKAVDRWYHRGRRDASTSMRSRCVEKLKALHSRFTTYRDRAYGEEYKYYAGQVDAVDTAIDALESLHLHDQEPKQS